MGEGPQNKRQYQWQADALHRENRQIALHLSDGDERTEAVSMWQPAESKACVRERGSSSPVGDEGLEIRD